MSPKGIGYAGKPIEDEGLRREKDDCRFYDDEVFGLRDDAE
jgi:hypothetical protein